MSDNLTVDSLDPFGGDHHRVGVGHAFESFDNGEVAVSTGDVVVFDDPDAGLHADECEFVHSEIIVSYVDRLYAVERDGGDHYTVEVGTTGPLGRLSVGSRYTAIITEDGVVGGDSISGPEREASRLVDHDEYTKYYQETRHLGEDGVPADLWDEYADSPRSGPGCPVCTGEEGNEGMVVTGE